MASSRFPLVMSLDVPARSLGIRAIITRYGNHIGLAMMLAGIFVTVMDGAIVNVAIPSIRTTLGATFSGDAPASAEPTRQPLSQARRPLTSNCWPIQE